MLMNADDQVFVFRVKSKPQQMRNKFVSGTITRTEMFSPV